MKNILTIIAVIIVLSAVALSVKNIVSGYTGIPTNQVSRDLPQTSGSTQDVKLSYRNYVYVLEPSTLKKGILVRLSVDLDTVNGCMRTVVIPAFGVNKRVSEGDNVITFTPDKSGTFGISCSMGMGRTTFNVADETGVVSEYSDPTPSPGGSCSSGAGCGCGRV
jgi:hypothetical protein